MQCQGQPKPAKDQWCMEIKGATSPLRYLLLNGIQQPAAVN